jgi:hypothetical protein
MGILYCRHCDICLEGEEEVIVDPTNGDEEYICPYCKQYAVSEPETDPREDR